MITKVLRSKYPSASGNEIFELPIKRAFNHLDWMNRGWLAPTEVEQLCLAGASKAHWVLQSSTIARIVRMEDDKHSNPDHHINLQKFINIVLAIREEILTAINAESSRRGLRNAASALSTWYASSDGKKMLSGHWSLQLRYKAKPAEPTRRQDKYPYRGLMPYTKPAGPRRRQDESPYQNLMPYTKPADPKRRRDKSPYQSFMTYTHEFSGDIPEKCSPLEPNITNAVYLATKYCVSQLNMASTKWRAGLRKWADKDRDEVTDALNNVLEGAAKFHALESNQRLDAFHRLDQLRETALIVPLSLFQDMGGCPLESIESMRMSCWSLLSQIIGFVDDLDDLSIPQRRKGTLALPDIQDWRRLRMLDRSRAISTMASRFTEAPSVLKAARRWYSQHESLEVYGKECVKYARLLRQEQENPVDFLKIHIDYVKMRAIRPIKIRKAFPHAIIEFFLTGAKGLLKYFSKFMLTVS